MILCPEISNQSCQTVHDLKKWRGQDTPTLLFLSWLQQQEGAVSVDNSAMARKVVVE